MLHSLHMRFSILFPSLALLAACSKPKLDQRTGNLANYQSIVYSRTRLVNVVGYTDISINGQLLTGGKYASNPDDVVMPTPTPWFPTTGRLGKSYYIPEQFFQNGTARIYVNTFANFSTMGSAATFTATDNYSQPRDYYPVRYRDGSAGSADQPVTDSIFVFPRTISASTDPTHIKIRLLNLSSGPDDAHLTGAMSLAFADGSSVSMTTNGVPSGQASDYIELPYGTYQFKVLTSDGRQVPGGGGNVGRYTGIIDGYNLTFAPVQTFAPGGAYSIVVSATTGFSYPSVPSYTATGYTAFQVVTDITPPANLNYARVQAVNAFPGTGEPLSLSIDGNPIGSALAYDSASPYSVLPTGSHYVALQNAHGQFLVQQLFTLRGGDNYTVWVYPDSSNRPALLFAQNNLSGSINYPAGDGSDNSNNAVTYKFPFWVRFLNLCPDLPSVTFTQNNGQLFQGIYGISGVCAQNLAPGKLPQQSFQYIVSAVDSMTTPILVYSSRPLVVPGDWLPDIAPLHSKDFVSSPASAYPNGFPQGEPGIYTVALTGRYGAAAAGNPHAKLIVLKHTK